ncbi:MAG: hypothetical protein OEY43_08665, partial [Gammaproteobacteria bacterium]|nr:hypothetical protein [Gammaproteobacteria bacterium]
RNAPADCSSGGPTVAAGYSILAVNDLGMHCADLDYQVFSILPPFNVLHAQVIRKGTANSKPVILTDIDADVVYSAASNPSDPAGSGSMNSSSMNFSGIFKSNFWQRQGANGGAPTLGVEAYQSLYPSILAVDPGNACLDSFSCPSVLTLFDAPLANDLGLPVPDIGLLYPDQGTAQLATGQQAMPGLANIPQHFDRFDKDLPFFVNFPFGSRLTDTNWFAADGIPILPVDDAGRTNAYPMMKVQAIRKGGDAQNPDHVMASLDVVLPVASEADCQGCHVNPIDCADPGLPVATVSSECNGSAVPLASRGDTTEFSHSRFELAVIDTAPGNTVEQQLLNAAKQNILRLHDAKHGAAYISWAGGSSIATPCDAASNPQDINCLANQTPVQCSQCHYSPALDLAQVGPVDEPEQGARGRQQTRHISMSRAMHGHHGEFSSLFPTMPAPVDVNGIKRDTQLTTQVLEQTCYQCHPGKRTQCLRGAMFSGGVVCQDCHGDMQQVGNDFSGNFATTPFPAGADLTKRVPWASEPACQSCHVGDALTAASIHTADHVVADDGIRLLQAYKVSDAAKPDLPMISAPASRFAENASLYRLSNGHGGVMCEGCHGSTHAIWPNQNPFANDNVPAMQLQGHTGSISECSVCHAEASLGLTLDGPHGMHPVNDANWNRNHEDIVNDNKDSCRSCHGVNGEGTVLSRMGATRTLACDGGSACSNHQITLIKGTEVGCGTCHENELR